MTIDILMVFNNYFNDMFVAFVFVTPMVYRMFEKFTLKKGLNDNVLMEKVFISFNKFFTWIFFLVIVGALIRAYTSLGFEFQDAIRNGQVVPLKVKYIMLLCLYVIGALRWTKIKKCFQKN